MLAYVLIWFETIIIGLYLGIDVFDFHDNMCCEYVPFTHTLSF